MTGNNLTSDSFASDINLFATVGPAPGPVPEPESMQSSDVIVININGDTSNQVGTSSDLSITNNGIIVSTKGQVEIND
jgi:hypothetical protein